MAAVVNVVPQYTLTDLVPSDGVAYLDFNAINSGLRIVTYRGTTTGTTSTEIFIDGRSGNRLLVPQTSVLMGVYVISAAAKSDDTHAYAGAYGWLGIRNVNGTTAMLANSPSQFTFPSTSPGISVTWAANDTLDALTLSVNASTAGHVLNWSGALMYIVASAAV